jgi:uncharacterized protein YbjT (DUF2867 family)
MILITGGTGKIGKALVKDLQTRGVPFRLMVRNEETRAVLDKQGIQNVPGDFTSPGSFPTALAGIKQVFLLTAPHPDGASLENAFLDASRKAGVQRVVRISAMGANPWSASPLLSIHGRCEAQLEASGLGWTILRPTMFMQNLALIYGESVAKTSTLFAPAGEARIPWIDCRDIAELAAVCLTSAGHEGMVYEITGAQAHSYSEVCEQLSACLGRTIKYVDVPDDAAYHAMLNMGMTGWFAHALITLFHQFRADRGLSVCLGTYPRIVGRPCRTLESYLQENLDVFRGVKAPSLTHSS